MVGEPCKLVFQNPFSQGKHKEVDGIIDCSNQCVIYDYSNLYNAYIDTCGDRKCEQQVDEYFQNPADDLTYYQRSKESYPNNTLLHDGMCHCGSEDCFNNQGSFENFTIPTLNPSRGPEDDNIIDLYPDLNCKEFNKLRKESHRGTYNNPCAMFNIQIVKQTRSFERDEFKFHFPEYDDPLNILYPNQSDDDAFYPFEIDESALRPIRLTIPLVAPTDCHCAMEQYIYSKNFTGFLPIIEDFCEDGFAQMSCRIANHFGAGYSILTAGTDFGTQLQQRVTNIKGATDKNLIGGTITVGFNIVGAAAQTVEFAFNFAFGLLNLVSDMSQPVSEHQLMEDLFGYSYFNQLMNTLDGVTEIADEFVLTGEIQKRLPLHYISQYYNEPAGSDNDVYAPFQLRDWKTDSADKCTEYDGSGDPQPFSWYCYAGEGWQQDFLQFLDNPYDSFFDWLFGGFEENYIFLDGIMEWYHESTPYRTGKSAEGTISGDYPAVRRIGPYSDDGEPTLSIRSESNLHTVDLTEVTPDLDSTLGVLDVAERFKLIDYPYSRALLQKQLQDEDALGDGGLSDSMLDELD